MATSEEKKEITRLLKILRGWRAWETRVLASIEGHKEELANTPDASDELKECYDGMFLIFDTNLAKGRVQIEGLKAKLATMEHLPNKAERRIARQESAKRGR